MGTLVPDARPIGMARPVEGPVEAAAQVHLDIGEPGSLCLVQPGGLSGDAGAAAPRSAGGRVRHESGPACPEAATSRAPSTWAGLSTWSPLSQRRPGILRDHALTNPRASGTIILTNVYVNITACNGCDS